MSNPASKDGAARIKARVDALAEVFVSAVAENRGVSVAQVLDAFGRGDVLIGAAAVGAGMADGFGTFESTLAALARGEQPAPRLAMGKAPPDATLRSVPSLPPVRKPAPPQPATAEDVAAFILASGRLVEGLKAGTAGESSDDDEAVAAILEAHRRYGRSL